MTFDQAPQRFDFASLGRTIPLDVRLRLLFGGLLNQLGWGLLGVGSIIFWGFAMQADLTSWYVFGDTLVQVPGKVLSSERTAYSSGKARRTRPGDSPNRIYGHHYEFTAADGVRRTGTSYARGPIDLKGKDVTIEHPVGDPDRSRIQNMRPMPLDEGAAFTVMFPLIGIIFLAFGYRSSRKALRLLKIGRVAEADLNGRLPTNWKVNNRHVYQLQFSFTADDGVKHTKSIRTHEPERFTAKHNVLLYNPSEPSDAEFLLRMSGRPQIDARDEINLSTAGRTWPIMLLPLATMLGNGAYLLSRVLPL